MKFRELDATERPKVNAFYSITAYSRPVSGADRVYIAEQSDAIYGAVRIEAAQGVQVLRGMYIHPEHLRQGIGLGLLSAIEPQLAKTESFCIPRDHLFDFYGRANFKCIKPNEAPAFLAERLQGYINEGLPVALMHRAQTSPA